MKNYIMRVFKTDERGATLVEYGILVALISVVAIVIISVLGGQIQAAFQNVSDQLNAAGISGS